MNKVILLCLILALFTCSVLTQSKNKQCLKMGQKCNFEKKRCCTGLNCYVSQNKCLPVKS
nr:venom polypeptide precursor [Doratifera vulnerans]